MQRELAHHCAEVERLEDWLDMDRTFTPVELSKVCPGWVDY